MRDPNRIDEVLREISIIWHKYPDMRLGQLIGNVLEGTGLYYVEDAGLVNALKDVYENAKEPISFDDDAYVFDLVKKHPGELCFVLNAKTYDEYVASYNTVSENPGKDAALSNDEFATLKAYFGTEE